MSLVGAAPVGGSAHLEVIPLQRIVGTVEPTIQFDGRFRPASETVRARWERIALARRTGVGLPPIIVQERTGGYYVVDGRHRVSVARALRDRDIEAWVMGARAASSHSSQQPLHDCGRVPPSGLRIASAEFPQLGERGLTRRGGILLASDAKETPHACRRDLPSPASPPIAEHSTHARSAAAGQAAGSPADVPQSVPAPARPIILQRHPPPAPAQPRPLSTGTVSGVGAGAITSLTSSPSVEAGETQ